MGQSFPFLLFHQLILFILLSCTILPSLSTDSSCSNKCGSLEIKYPLGTGHGCGSPRFYPYVHCDPGENKLLLTTHTGSYPITSISYSTSTLIISPPEMSTCNSMQPASNLGLDWLAPFQLGSSVFILLSCPSPTTSLTVKGVPICDSTYTHLCASLHTCPSVRSLGLPLYAPTDTCCVYSPPNLNTKGDLDLHSLKCAAYASVRSLGDVPTDPNRWEYGIKLVYNQVGFDNNYVGTVCFACEKSDGICGYAPPRNDFVCVCKNGVNSSTDCNNRVSSPYWTSGSPGGWVFFNGYYLVFLLSVFYFALVLFLL